MNRLREVIGKVTDESQLGFIPNKGIVDGMIIVQIRHTINQAKEEIGSWGQLIFFGKIGY